MSKHVEKATNCRMCGEIFVNRYGTKLREFCSRKCCRRYTSRIRKVRLKLVTPVVESIEPFGPWEIYRRDNYTCQLCGDPVNLAADLDDPYSPTIDHIIPLANGGVHKRENVQTAHRFCNSLKSDKPIPAMFFAINRMGAASNL